MTFTAVCKEPSGYRYQYQPGASAPSGFEDGFLDAVWSFSWDSTKGREGHVITQSSKSAGSEVYSAPSIVLLSNEDRYVTFLAPYPQAMWTYTIFPDAGILMASRHKADVAGEGTDGALFHAKCNVAIQ